MVPRLVAGGRVLATSSPPPVKEHGTQPTAQRKRRGERAYVVDGADGEGQSGMPELAKRNRRGAPCIVHGGEVAEHEVRQDRRRGRTKEVPKIHLLHDGGHRIHDATLRDQGSARADAEQDDRNTVNGGALGRVEQSVEDASEAAIPIAAATAAAARHAAWHRAVLSDFF